MRIAQVIQGADSWGEISPLAFERGIGGREGALVRLATEWAKLGHEVTNFVPVKKANRFQAYKDEELDLKKLGQFREYSSSIPMFREKAGFHEYIPFNLAKPMLASFPYDAVVSWECPSIYSDERILEKQKVRLTHMQVAHFNEGEQEAADRFSTGVVALSEWAKNFLVHDGLIQKNLYVRPNGVDLASYPWNGPKKVGDKISFVYSSSPDRGLWHLLKMWKEIRGYHPNANLYVAYGVDKYVNDMVWAHSRVGQMCIEIIELMQQPGVVDLGKIGQKQLADLQMKATAWIYPADTIQATETGCITAIENMAAGNPCFMSDADCLEDEFKDVACIEHLPFDPYDYVGDVLEAIHYPDTHYTRMSEKGRAFAETRDWKKIAPTWIELFEENKNVH